MFVQGLSLDPEDVDQHKALRDLSLKRKVSGGKAMGMFEARKHSTSTKDDKQNMLNAERMLAFDPGNLGHMVTFAQSAFRGGFYDTAMWISDLLLHANAESPRPDHAKFLVLKDIYKGLNDYKQASDCAAAALQLKPNDMDLMAEMKGLAANDAINKGGYGRAKSFRDSIKDMSAQQKEWEDNKDVKSEDILLRKVRETEAEWRATPDDVARFGKYIDALKATESMEHENIAIEHLEQMFKKTRQFKYRARAGEFKMGQLNRMERAMIADVKAHPTDARKKKELEEFHREKIQSELEEFRLITENYPTDATARYKMAERMFWLGQYQDVIPVLQQVRHSPQYKAMAGTLLGRAFLEAGFGDEAVDTIKSVIDDYPTRGDERYKDMLYYYGRALEAKGDNAVALKQYSLVAQIEFKYKDVQERIKRLRAEGVK